MVNDEEGDIIVSGNERRLRLRRLSSGGEHGKTAAGSGVNVCSHVKAGMGRRMFEGVCVWWHWWLVSWRWRSMVIQRA